MDNETIQTSTTEQVVSTEPVAAPVGTPQQQTREEIYQKYYGQQTVAPQATTAIETAPEPETPAPTSEPAVTPSAPAAAPAIDHEFIKQAVADAIRSIAQPPAPVQPQAATTEPATPPDPSAWVQELIKGDYVNATNSLKKLVLDAVKAEIAPELSRTTLSEATENFKAETELNAFVNSIRESNADIIKLEPLIAPKIQIQMAQWLQSEGGKVAPAAYVEQYKKVATAEINEARNLIQSFRAAGATGAQQVKQEVLSSTTLSPSPVQVPQGNQGPPAPQDAKSYLQMRQEMANARNGMRMRN